MAPEPSRDADDDDRRHVAHEQAPPHSQAVCRCEAPDVPSQPQIPLCEQAVGEDVGLDEERKSDPATRWILLRRKQLPERGGSFGAIALDGTHTEALFDERLA